MKRLLVIVIAVLLLALISVLSIRMYERVRSAPRNDQIRQARDLGAAVIADLESYRTKNGRFPCYLKDAVGDGPAIQTFGVPGSASALGWYQATTSSYFLFLRNPGGIPTIRWRTSDWEPCSDFASCPPNEFASYCCGRENYPTCESYEGKG